MGVCFLDICVLKHSCESGDNQQFVIINPLKETENGGSVDNDAEIAVMCSQFNLIQYISIYISYTCTICRII